MKREFDRDIPMPPLPLNLVGLTPLVPPFTTDPMGSYTGLTEDDHDKPQQDVDDRQCQHGLRAGIHVQAHNCGGCA
mgnify:CR=1 FL=1